MEYFQPRIIEHVFTCGIKEYAIHEVYFDSESHKVINWTNDALSNRHGSEEKLWEEIKNLKKNRSDQIMGDLQYDYNKDRFENWLRYKEKGIAKTYFHKTTKEENLDYWRERIELKITNPKKFLGLE